MTHPEKPDRRLPSAESPKQQAAASRETSRPADSVPVVAGQFANFPATFGRYRVEQLLGRGAMGSVYLARDTQLDRPVALKIPKVAASGSKRLLLRLETEAKAAAQLDHPSLCKVYDAGEINGQCFIAMQFIEGETLKTQLDAKSKSAAEAVTLMVQLAEGLSEAHALGIIHRDLKPENIMISRRGVPVIMDFGLAKFSTISSNAKATQAGTILGSPAYMSPEQASGNVQEIDQRSDLYALGTILFEMLTGELPFSGSAMQVLGQKSLLDPPSPLNLKPNLPPQLAAICHKMIAKNSVDRYQSLNEVIRDLQQNDLTSTPAVATPAIESSTAFPFAFPELSVPEESDERVASVAAPQKMTRAKGDVNSRTASLTPLQLVTAWWKNCSPATRWATLNGAGALLIILGVLVFFPTKDGALAKPIGNSLVLDSTRVKKAPKVIKAGVEGKQGDAPAPPIVSLEAAQAQVHQWALAKKQLPRNEWIDVLPAVKLPDHVLRGQWSRENSDLISVGGGEAFIPIVAAGDYQVRLVFTPKDGSDITCRFPIGGGRSSAILYGGWGEGTTCIPGVDGGNNHCVRHPVIQNDVKHALIVTVRQNANEATIISTLDEQPLISFQGRKDRLQPSCSLPSMAMFGLSLWHPTVRFHEFKLRLEGNGVGYFLAENDWKTRLMRVANEPTLEIGPKCVDWKGKKYLISENHLIYPEAQSLAVRVGGRVLTISSKEEEEFLDATFPEKSLWVAAWCSADPASPWRDERNRPLRYRGNWATGNPSLDGREQFTVLNTSTFNQYKGLHDVGPHEPKVYACIEWGEEYPEDGTPVGK